VAKHKSAKNAALLSWLSANADNREGRFIQIGNSLYLSKAFQSLTDGAKYTYQCMSMEAGGKRQFELPNSAFAKYGLPSRSCRRHIAELEEKGFIKKQSGQTARLPNLYEFSLEWKSSKRE